MIRHASRHAFTVDVEDGISIAMRDNFRQETPQEGRVVTNTGLILDLLAKHHTKATFFVLGKVAEEFPHLVRDIHQAGHELGVHGYHHIVFDKLTPEAAFTEVSSAKQRIEDLIGCEVLGHRAPRFSINGNTAWALDVLIDAGFRYDSSVLPCKGFRNGWPGQARDIGWISAPSGRRILEVPLSVGRIAGRQMPGIGGSYFRLLPYSVSKRMIDQIGRKRPAIVYLHPYEVDTVSYPDYFHAAMKQASLKAKFFQRLFWINRRLVLGKYDKLLSDFRFSTIQALLAESPDCGSATQ